MVNDLNHTHRKKPKLTLPTPKSLDNFSDTLNPFSDNQTPSIKNPTGITSPPPFYTKRPNKFRLTRLQLFPKRQPLAQHQIIIELLYFLPHKNKIHFYVIILLPIQLNMTI